MGSFETAISTTNDITDYASTKFMDVISGYDEVINQYTDMAEFNTQQALDAVSGMLEQSLQAILEMGRSDLFDSMGINKENLQLAQDILKLAGGTVSKLQSIVSVVPTGLSVTPSTKECMTALCKSYKDLLVEQYKSLKLIYDETVNASITCMGSVIDVAKDAVKTVIAILEDTICDQVYKWTGYHLIEIIYMCQKGIAMYRQYKELKNKINTSSAGYESSVNLKINPEDLKLQLLDWLKFQNDTLYNAFIMLMMQDVIQDLKDDIEKLTNMNIKLIANDINTLDDLVNFVESLGIKEDTPGLALTEIMERGLNGIASTVSALNTIKDNATSLASPETLTAAGSMIIGTTSVQVNYQKTFEITPTDAGDHIDVQVYIYKDPTKGKILKNIRRKFENIKYDGKKVFENSQIGKIIDNIVSCCKNNGEAEFAITGKINGMPKPYQFFITYVNKEDEKDNAEENNTVKEKEANPELDTNNISIPVVTEELWNNPEKKKATFEIIKILYNTLKPMCPMLKELAKLIQNYKINKAKVQGNAHINLAEGLKKVLDVLGLTNRLSIADKNMFTVRTYKMYIYCLTVLKAQPDNQNLAELDAENTNTFHDYLLSIRHKNMSLVEKDRATVLYFDKENIDLEKQAIDEQLSYKPQMDGNMANMDNIRVVDDMLFFTDNGKSTLTSQIMCAIQRGDEPYKNNIIL